MSRSIPELNRITSNVIGAAIEVHRNLGPALLESSYRERVGLLINFNVAVLKSGIRRRILGYDNAEAITHPEEMA